MTAAFYNTPGLSGAELAKVEASAGEQNALVLAAFRDAGKPMSAHEAWLRTGIEFPGSVRRAVTTLTTQNKLVKTTQQVLGPYGVRVFLWTLAA